NVMRLPRCRCGILRSMSRYTIEMPHTCARAIILGVALICPATARAQVDCWAPREAQDTVATPKFTAIRQTLLTLEEIIRKNVAYQTPPEPVRMRTTVAAGPSEAG